MSFMGDETVELLSKEASSWNKANSHVSNGTNGSSSDSRDFRRQDMKALDKQRVPLEASLKPLPADGKANIPEKAHLRSTLRKATQDFKIASAKPLRKTIPKKRPSEDDTSQEKRFLEMKSKYISPLNLDSDLDSILNEDRHPQYAESVISRSTTPETMSSITSISSVNGLKLRMQDQLDMPKSCSANTSVNQETVDGLLEALNAKDREVIQLKAELESAKREHQSEMAALAKELHNSYSKQASEKLRILYEKAITNARRDLEDSSESEVKELRILVEKERKEKAELVKACDDYLMLNGF